MRQFFSFYLPTWYLNLIKNMSFILKQTKVEKKQKGSTSLVLNNISRFFGFNNSW